MKAFISFIAKEFRHIFRDKRTVLIVMIMPIVQIILFGYAVSTEVNNVRVCIVGDLSDPEVRSVVEKIDNNKFLYVSGFLSSVDNVEDMFKMNKADAAICFESDFDKKMDTGMAQVRIIGDGSDPNTAQMTTSFIRGTIQNIPSFIPMQLMYNPSMKSSYNFVPGVMGLILMLICSMMTAISIVREKETGTMELLLVSPIKPLWIIVSKAIPYFVLSIGNFAIILLLSHFVMDVPIRGSIWLLSLVAIVFILASLAIGLLISEVSGSQRTALLISGMGLTMPTMIFSGIIFPCESMPEILRLFSHIIPAKWFIIMVKKIMIQGGSFGNIITEFTILSSMAVFLLAVSIRNFKTRLK